MVKYLIIKINKIINKLLLPIISNKSNKLLNKTSSASLLRLVYADPQLAQLPQAVTDIKNNKNIINIKNSKNITIKNNNIYI